MQKKNKREEEKVKSLVDEEAVADHQETEPFSVLCLPFLILIKGPLQDKQCLPTYAAVQTVEPAETQAMISKRSLTSWFNLCAK